MSLKTFQIPSTVSVMITVTLTRRAWSCICASIISEELELRVWTPVACSAFKWHFSVTISILQEEFCLHVGAGIVCQVSASVVKASITCSLDLTRATTELR